MSGHLKRAASPELLEDLVESVYAEVWDSFYECDVQYCQEAIGSLAVNGPASRMAQSLNCGEDLEDKVSDVLDGFQNMKINTRSSNPAFSITEFGSGKAHTSSVFAEEIALQGSVACSEPYEAFTPCLQSIHVGDDSDSLPFIPCADEPMFNIDEYTDFYGSLSWQGHLFRDPDRMYA